MANEATITFGPFARCVTSVEAHVAPADAMTSGLNMLVDPIAGGAFKRSGFAIAGGDVVSGATNHATNGILENGITSWVPLRVRPFFSEALDDGAPGGYPTYSVLYGHTDPGVDWPLVDQAELQGTEYVRRESGLANYSLMQEFGAAAYPTDGGSGGGAFSASGIYYKVVPFWYESGEGGYNRGAFEFARRYATAGAWATVDAGRWRYYGNLNGTPIRWDGGCNDSASVVANSIRIMPTGPLAPHWPPVAATGTASAASFTTADSDYPWLEGDTFFLSVMYQFEDGSYSLPVVPRAPNAILTSGLGFVTVGSAAVAGGSKHKYKTLEYTKIPIGPPGTIARVLLRSKKQNREAATAALTIDISDLRILGVLRNNIQTSYTDTLADDDGLLQDTDVVRWDLICPPRSRYLGTGDQRVIAGYTLPNPVAIQLTVAGIAVDYDQNKDELLEAPGATSACYRITATGLDLITATGGAINATLTVDWATYDTVQKVVDKVNTTVVGGNYGQWRAQVAPGADPNAGSSGLCPSVIAVTNCTATSTALATTTSRGMEGMPVGYKCYAAAGMTAGTYVRAKDCSVTTLNACQLSQASTTAAATVTFYADTGDEACVTTAGSKGWIRAFGSAYPGMVYFKRSALVGYNSPRKDRIYFTISSPGAAATGVSVAPNAWGASNRRDGVNNPGQLMGIVDVDGAAVLLYRDRIGLFVNERGSNTGEDFDYRIKTINGQHGCISPWSVVSAAGCAVYATATGIKATDKSRREILLSGDIYQPASEGRSLGDLTYEVTQCVAAAARDSMDCMLGGAVWRNQLVYAYHREATLFGFSVYDFSPGTDQLGLEALANPETRSPYGWSTTCIMDVNNDTFGPRVMGAVPADDGVRLYAAIKDNSGVTDGRIDRMFYGSTDNGGTIGGEFRTKMVLADPGMRFSAQSVTSLHRSSYTGPLIYIVRIDSGFADNQATVTSSGSNTLTYERLQWEQVARTPGKVLQLIWSDQATSTGAMVFKLDQSVEILRKVGN